MPPVGIYKNAVGLLVSLGLDRELSEHWGVFLSSGSKKHLQQPFSPFIDMGNYNYHFVSPALLCYCALLTSYCW